MKKHLVILTLFALPTLSPAALGEEDIYRWVDSKGKVHYTQTRPKDNNAEKIFLKDTGKNGLDAGRVLSEEIRELSGDTDGLQTGNSSLKSQQNAGNEQCAMATENLEALESGQPVEKLDPMTGKTLVLSEEARKLEIEYAQQFLEVYCK